MGSHRVRTKGRSVKCPRKKNLMKGIMRTVLLVVFLAHNLVPVLSFSSKELASLKRELFHQYEKTVRPSYNVTPVIVGVEMFILDITKFNTEDKEFTLDLYLRHFWEDERLGWDESDYDVEKIVLTKAEDEKSWKPDIFFYQERRREKTMTSFLRISSTGSVLWSSRLRLVLGCQVNLATFPFDHQVCPITLESYSRTNTDILFVWKE